MSRAIFRLSLLTVVSLVWTSTVARADNRYQRWQSGKPFIIGAMYYDLAYGPVWWKPVPKDFRGDPVIDVVKQAGLNLLDEVSMSSGGHTWYPGLRTVRRQKLPFLILAGPWEPYEHFQTRVKWFAEDPNFFGVQLADEPQKPANQKVHRRQQLWIEKTHPRLLTLICESLTNTPAWEAEWAAIKCDAIIFQWYPYDTSDGRSPTITRPVFACLERAARHCESHGLGFFVARGIRSRPKSESTLRLNTFAALAAGCRGFVDFTWGASSPESGYVWYKDKSYQGPSRRFQMLAKINREVAHLGPCLLKLRAVRTYHADLHTHLTWAGRNYGFDEPDKIRTGQLVAVEGSPVERAPRLMIGVFRDAANQEYFLVVNKRESRAVEVDHDRLIQQVTLRFRGDVTAVERINRETGKIERLPLKDGAVRFSLPGGTGDLLKVSNGRPFAGIK